MKACETFVSKPAQIPEVLNQIRKLGMPDKFDKEFLQQVETDHAVSDLYIYIFKHIGLINDNLVPIEKYYSDFIDSAEKSQAVIRQQVRANYKEIFKRNQKAHQLSEEKIKNLFHELLGDKKSDTVINLVARTFKGLIDYSHKNGDFNSEMKQKVSANIEYNPSSKHISKELANGSPTTLTKKSTEDQSPAKSNNSIETEETEEVSGKPPSGSGPNNTDTETSRNHSSGAQENGEPISNKKFLKKAILRRAQLHEKMDNKSEAADSYHSIINYAKSNKLQIDEQLLTEAFYKSASLLEEQERYNEAVNIYDQFIETFG
jgi:tetratricopeptide (TPR) repeat protein